MEINELFSKYENKILEDRNDNLTVEEYTKQLLEDYLNDAKTLPHSILRKDNHNSCIDDIKEANNIINNCLEKYKFANIAESINLMYHYLERHETLYYVKAKTGTIWYRMRKTDKNHRVFPANEMFHLPFNLRGKVGIQRFSISGYPCLYLGLSVYTCWEEMHQPPLAEVCVSALENIENIKLLDLRLPDNNIDLGNIEDVRANISRFPLIMASSLKVKNYDDVFKSEYIIPQLVMLAIANLSSFYGCAFTSTHRNKSFLWGKDILTNIALPVRSVGERGLCPKLTGLFKISDSTCYEYEIIKNRITSYGSNVEYYDAHGKPVDMDDYKMSLFGQIEQSIQNNFERKQI